MNGLRPEISYGQRCDNFVASRAEAGRFGGCALVSLRRFKNLGAIVDSIAGACMVGGVVQQLLDQIATLVCICKWLEEMELNSRARRQRLYKIHPCQV